MARSSTASIDPPLPEVRQRGWSRPLAPLQRRWKAWWLDRHPVSDTLRLTQRNIYILPTRPGVAFGGTLVVLLLGSINYQLNLGYILTFLLAGSAVVSMHVTHRTLRGLQLHLRPPQPVFAGSAAVVDVTLDSEAPRARFGIGLRLGSATDGRLAWCDVPAGAHSQAQVSFVPPGRGRHEVPAIHIETRFPLGLFRAWSVWRPAAQVLVYPRAESPAAPLPPMRPLPGGSGRGRSEGGDTEGIRSYRRGDSLKLVLWKKSASRLAAGGELVSRDTANPVQQELWLDWQQCAGLAPEDRLSRLTAWVLLVDRLDVDHGLRLPGTELPPAHGEAQRRACLEALALWA